MATPEDIQRIARANDIVEVIGSYLPLKPCGTGFRALSPFARENTPSFFVHPVRQTYFCFASSQSGDVIQFVQKIENISFKEALEKLAARAGLSLPDEGPVS